MPVDNLMYTIESTGRFWRRQFAWRPQRCYRTGRLIWLTWGYSGRSRMVLNTPVLWMTSTQYFLKCLIE